MSKLAITDIDIVFGDNEIQPGWEKVDVDLNQGAQGRWIFLVAKRDPEKQTQGQWITWINAVGLQPDQGLPDESNDQFHFIRKNLNEGAGGREIYLRFDRDGEAPIYDLTVTTSRTPVDLDQERWHIDPQDLNEGTVAGASVLHLAFTNSGE